MGHRVNNEIPCTVRRVHASQTFSIVPHNYGEIEKCLYAVSGHILRFSAFPVLKNRYASHGSGRFSKSKKVMRLNARIYRNARRCTFQQNRSKKVKCPNKLPYLSSSPVTPPVSIARNFSSSKIPSSHYISAVGLLQEQLDSPPDTAFCHIHIEHKMASSTPIAAAASFLCGWSVKAPVYYVDLCG